MAEPGATKLGFPDGFVVVHVLDRTLFVLLIEWTKHTFCTIAMLVVLSMAARAARCTRIEGVGRRGWCKKLFPLGFTQDEDGTYVKEL